MHIYIVAFKSFEATVISKTTGSVSQFCHAPSVKYDTESSQKLWFMTIGAP